MTLRHLAPFFVFLQNVIHVVDVLHLVVSAAEEVVPEALRDRGPDSEDLGDVLSSDQHVSVVQLDVHVRLFVQQVVGPTCRS